MPNLPVPPVSPSQPLAQWSAIALAAITAFTAHTSAVDKADYDADTAKVVAFEDQHHEAIIDLRRKIEFLYKRVLELEVGQASAVQPPGPGTFFNPPAPLEEICEEDAGVAPDAEIEEDVFVPPSPPEKKPVEQKEGMPVWKPMKKMMEKK